MKKTLAIILSIVMAISLLPLSAFAENGPRPYDEEEGSNSYIVAYELNSDGEPATDEDGAMIMYYIFDSSESGFEDDPSYYVSDPDEDPIVDPDEDPIDDPDEDPIDDPDGEYVDEPYDEYELDGVYYDEESNTLYLDNLYYPELAIEAYFVGDDFTLNVKGVCEIARITVEGGDYGGSLKIDGTGKLIVNGDGFSTFGILVSGHECESALTFGEKVTVEAYGDEFSVAVNPTFVEDGEEAIVFENGEEHEVVSSQAYDESVQMVLGFSLLDPDEIEEPQQYGFKAICEDDPDGDYVFTENVDEETSEVSYTVLKLVYIEEYDTYIPDINYGDQGGYEFSEEEWPESGFAPVYDDDDNLIPFINENPVDLNVMFLATDAEGNYYGLTILGFDDDFNISFGVCDITEIEGVDGIYYAVPNDEINAEDLEPVTEIVYMDGLYFHLIDEENFSYTGTKFPDVPKNAWFYEAAMYNAYNGYIGGYKNGKFGPADALQRQDFVVILARIAGVDLSEYEGQTGGLKDVKADAYYAAAVAWAVDAEIITGYKNGNFGVGDKITREQVATILYRALGDDSGEEDALAGFSDKGKVSDFAKEAMIWAVSNGIISGKNKTTLAPTDTASRAEIATIIMRMDQKGLFNPKHLYFD